MFNIYPTESVLLGVALGEYVRLQEFNAEDTFESVLYRRVYPFVPDLAQERLTPTSEKDMPADLEWHDFGDGAQRASFQTDNVAIQFERRGGKLFRVDQDEGRRSMLDLLMEYMTEGDERPRRKWNERDDLFVRWNIKQRTDRPKSRLDSTIEIKKWIERLVYGNRLREPFETGKSLGQAFGDCVRAEKYLIFVEESFDDLDDDYRSISTGDLVALSKDAVFGVRDELFGSLEGSWGDFVQRIGKDPVFVRCFHAPDFVRNPKMIFGGRYFGLCTADEVYGSVLNAMLSMRTNLCLILGGILGVLNTDELEAKARDAQQPTSRAFSTSSAALNDTIGGSIYRAELDLNEKRETKVLPETIVSDLGHTIEGLSRRIWPDAPKGEISKVLHEKKKFGTELERRFAAIALPLYVMYRNVAEHEPNTFWCSNLEARHFVTGMRALDDLAKRIVVER